MSKFMFKSFRKSWPYWHKDRTTQNTWNLTALFHENKAFTLTRCVCAAGGNCIWHPVKMILRVYLNQWQFFQEGMWGWHLLWGSSCLQRNDLGSLGCEQCQRELSVSRVRSGDAVKITLLNVWEMLFTVLTWKYYTASQTEVGSNELRLLEEV